MKYYNDAELANGKGKPVSFFFTEKFVAGYTNKEIHFFVGGTMCFPAGNIVSHAWPEKNNHGENLNDCHYCPTNYSRSIIQPPFRVESESKSINVTDPTNDTPLFVEYRIVRRKCFRSRWYPYGETRALWIFVKIGKVICRNNTVMLLHISVN